MKTTILTTILALVASTVGLAQEYRVVAIDEAPGRTMSAETFPQADPEDIKKYMPTGGAPASVSTLVLFAGEDVVLFDTGNGGDLMLTKLLALGVRLEMVKFVFLTHFHGDHIGGLFQGGDRRFPNAKVLASASEYDFYAMRERQPQGTAFGRVKAAYGADFVKFNFDDEVFSNAHVTIKALDASGHTPGHTAFLIEPKQAEKEKMLVIGDLLHAAALQFPVPEICAVYDSDKEKAVVARKRLLDFAANEKILIGGMHFPPPSIGTVKKEGNGYKFELKK